MIDEPCPDHKVVACNCESGREQRLRLNKDVPAAVRPASCMAIVSNPDCADWPCGNERPCYSHDAQCNYCGAKRGEVHAPRCHRQGEVSLCGLCHSDIGRHESGCKPHVFTTCREPAGTIGDACGAPLPCTRHVAPSRADYDRAARLADVTKYAHALNLEIANATAIAEHDAAEALRAELKAAEQRLVHLENHRDEDELRHLKIAAETNATIQRLTAPIPMRLPCEACGDLHIDEGGFATKPHHTHQCATCGLVWRPAVQNTVGVRYLWPQAKDPA